jgi:dTDP-4-dehydrorhamnose reductase
VTGDAERVLDLRVLVTGAAGMLGAEVLPLLGADCDVVAADLDEFDLRDAEAVSAFVTRAAPQVVVNCAAYTNVDAAESDPASAFAVNADGAGNVAAAAAAAGARMVHMSTDYVFDGTSSRPYSEEDRPCPLGVYGRSKLEGERRVLAAARDCLIVRTAWLYGHSGANFVEKMLELAAAGGPLRVVDDQVGAPTNARDLAGSIRELIAVGAAGVVNATNAGSCSWYEFACEIVQGAGLGDVAVEPVKSSEFPRPAPRPAYSVLSLDRLMSLTGASPRHWREGLADYLSERST